MNFTNKLRYFLEKEGFRVSSRLSDRFGFRVRIVRLFFIYITFFTLGGWLVLYVVTAFLLRLKDMVYIKRNSVFDL